jgi:hypothetical protein
MKRSKKINVNIIFSLIKKYFNIHQSFIDVKLTRRHTYSFPFSTKETGEKKKEEKERDRDKEEKKRQTDMRVLIPVYSNQIYQQ